MKWNNEFLIFQTITETITVTHFEENKKNLDEKDKKIEELLAVSVSLSKYVRETPF